MEKEKVAQNEQLYTNKLLLEILNELKEMKKLLLPHGCSIADGKYKITYYEKKD